VLLVHVAELLAAGQRAVQIEMRAKQHLQHCPDCRKDHEQRLETLFTEQAGSDQK
jgi:hypothetical protein